MSISKQLLDLHTVLDFSIEGARTFDVTNFLTIFFRREPFSNIVPPPPLTSRAGIPTVFFFVPCSVFNVTMMKLTNLSLVRMYVPRLHVHSLLEFA